ncbi:hypothetical protein Hden_2980 [Hyphomicrobium denitrificans ATCC 51888]|uniref:Uncharacterized protein n=1 Tax=Hyphomicrobium denitrificans (strain ATCC 51888 / DSM 1869 / NCIMB 11706 / TK 0415) TaxID=582899 RepID=D8JVC1_HYPDA|nr:hypothetical protein [Hyphomicrobium denitrificans]ADJ24775.1 hypothetical protein Hden_2980 [Hyphomicrobium denitrificans ATCC 51888]
MYALKLPSVKSPVRQAEPVRGRARHIRDDLELPDAIDPAIGFEDEPAPATEEPVVQAVTPVDPQVKKYRATITRTVTQSAIVEYEALETQGQYSVAEDLAAQVPAESWTTDAENSWCYIDKLEDLGPASAATSEIDTADDDTLETDPAADEDDEQDALLTAGRNRRGRRARAVRAMPDELIAQAQDILDQASAAASTLGTESSDPQAIVDTLSQLLQQVQDLQANADGDASGADADIEAQVSAVQFLNDVAQQISQMIEEAQADVFAAEDEAAAAAA